MTNKTSTCGLCGEPMPLGEEMFKYHGYSGECPKPPITKPSGEKVSKVFDNQPKTIKPSGELSNEARLTEKFNDADTNPAVAYELGRHDERLVFAHYLKEIISCKNQSFCSEHQIHDIAELANLIINKGE